MYFEEEIKLEDCSNSKSTLCFACLSSTRILSSLGEYCAIFGKLLDYKCSPDLLPISLCWECTAVLRKVKLFKEKVDHAQTVLSYHYLSQGTPPSCLSSLNTTEVEISMLGTKLEQEVDNTNELPTHEEIQTDRNYLKQNESDGFEIKEELDNDAADDMFILGWEDDDVSNHNNAANMVDDNELENTKKSKPECVKIEKKKVIKGKALKSTGKVIKRATKTIKSKKLGKKVAKTENEETPPTTSKQAEMLDVKSFKLITAERAVLLDSSRICAKRQRTSAKFALQHVKAALKPDPENEEQKTAPKIYNQREELEAKKREEDSDFDCEIEAMLKRNKQRRDREKNKKNTDQNERLIPYRKYLTDDIAINEVPVALDDIRMWMDKDRDTEVFKNFEFKCELCVKSIGSEIYNRKHRHEHNKRPSRPFYCEVCSHGFATESRLRGHMKHHSKLLECSACGFKCYLAELMEKHVEDHRKKYQCLTCQDVFPSLEEFYKHYRICDYCGEPFKDKSRLQKHIFRCHTVYSCKQCDIVFKVYQKYKYHLTTRHHVKRVSAARNQPAEPEDFYCVSCDKHFMSAQSLEIHLKKSQAHSDERPTSSEPKPKKARVPCPVCPKTYQARCLMMNHYNFVHLEQYNYKCDLCGKSLIDRTHLQSHIRRVHEGVRDPKNKFCPHCNRGFSCNATLRHHIRTHTGERPYQCEHCDARFAQSTACKQHVKFVHLKEKRGNPTL